MTNDEAIEMIRNDMKLHHDSLSGEYRKALRMAISALSQPQRMKGRWIRYPKICKVECDQCGKRFRTDFTPRNFCPSCGADMRGEQDG